MEPYRRSVPYLRTAERNRLAKMRFLNATASTADPVPVKVASSTDCTDHTEQPPPPPNPFTAFLESMDRLRTGRSNAAQDDRLMAVLASLEQQAAQTTAAAEATPPPSRQPDGAFERDYYGYRHAGTFNGRSTLRVWPSVRRSLSRRSSVESLGGGDGGGGYASDGGAARPETAVERQRSVPLAGGQ